MSNPRKYIEFTPALYQYVAEHTRWPHPALARLVEETAALPGARMQVSPDQGAFMHLMAKLTGARFCLEVGCYTGYSAISVATALPPEGRLITLDVDADTTAIARRYFDLTGVADRVELRLAPALEMLPRLREEFGPGSFDFIFIDADKENYPLYWDLAVELVRAGGLILVDNVLWNGRVVEEANPTAETLAIRRLNDIIRDDTRVDAALVGISDGIFVCRRR